ncbi:MAG: hypothetical protein ACI8W7_000620 [Gammaproteobacteria bacterium]|jgi:hypothetical protein
MGLLDELKQEAQAIEAEKARETTSREKALAGAREQIEPCMRRAYKYFSELKQHLQVVDREIDASYEIRGAGKIDGLKQGQYGVSTENPDQLDKFTFRCVCAKSGALQVNQDDVAAVTKYRDYLRDNGLQAKMRDSTKVSGGVVFMVQPAVPVVVEFSANYERVIIALRVRNLTSIGVARHLFRPEQVDEKFLDEVAKTILRQPSKLAEITGDVLSNTSKMELKKKVQAAIREQEIADQVAQREAAEERTITKRFARTFLGRNK